MPKKLLSYFTCRSNTLVFRVYLGSYPSAVESVFFSTEGFSNSLNNNNVISAYTLIIISCILIADNQRNFADSD